MRLLGEVSTGCLERHKSVPGTVSRSDIMTSVWWLEEYFDSNKTAFVVESCGSRQILLLVRHRKLQNTELGVACDACKLFQLTIICTIEDSALRTHSGSGSGL